MSSLRMESRFAPPARNATRPPAEADGAITSVQNESSRVDDEDEALVFEALYDLTDERLSVIFSSFDTDADGRIDYESLKRGLKEWQDQAGVKVSALEEEAFATFVSMLDEDSSQDLSYQEFCEAFRQIMLQTLLSHHDDTDVDEGSPYG